MQYSPLPFLARAVLPAWTFRFLPIPYERTMREMNQAYDGMIAAARQRNYPERMATLSLWSIEVDREVQGGGYLNLLSADWAISLLLPMLQKATTTLESARMEYNLARVALSLADGGSLSGMPLLSSWIRLRRTTVASLMKICGSWLKLPLIGP